MNPLHIPYIHIYLYQISQKTSLLKELLQQKLLYSDLLYKFHQKHIKCIRESYIKDVWYLKFIQSSRINGSPNWQIQMF
jgi:hypothetical protein